MAQRAVAQRVQQPQLAGAWGSGAGGARQAGFARKPRQSGEALALRQREVRIEALLVLFWHMRTYADGC